jgi:hypothetical protein
VYLNNNETNMANTNMFFFLNETELTIDNI